MPVAVTWNVASGGTVTVAWLGEINLGGMGVVLTVKVKLCVAFGLTSLDAVIVKAWLPAAVVAAIVIRPVEPLMLTPVG